MVKKKRYDRGDIRRLNAVSVLDQLREGSLSRARIAEQLGLTRATVSSIVTDLLKADLVKETDYLEGGTGRPGLQLELNHDAACVIALEIDLDRLSLVLANAGKEVVYRKDIPLPLGMPLEEGISLAEDLLSEAVEKGLDTYKRCFGICLAWAGLVNRSRGELAYGPSSGWENVPIKQRWEAKFGIPVFVENEAHTGAIGAHLSGQGKGKRNMIFLSLGVGLAAGIIVDGILLRGKQGFAGQVGHTHFTSNGIKCHCGKSGCWVTEIGASAIIRKLEQAGMRFSEEEKSGTRWIERIEQAMQQQDPVVTEVLSGIGTQIGLGLTRLVHTFNPSMILIGGRLGKLFHPVEPAILSGLSSSALSHMTQPLKVQVSESDDDQLIGCMDTVIDSVMNNPPLGE